MTTMVSFSSSIKQGTFQVHGSAVCLFCTTHLVKLNYLFENAISGV